MLLMFIFKPHTWHHVMLVEDSSVESFNIKVAQNNIYVKKPKSLGFILEVISWIPNLIIVHDIITLQ